MPRSPAPYKGPGVARMGMASTAATPAHIPSGGQKAQHRVPAVDPVHRQRAETEKAELAQRDLSAVPRQRDERQRQKRQARAALPKVKRLLPVSTIDRATHDARAGRRAHDRVPEAGHLGRPHPHHPADAEPHLGDDEQRNEEQRHRQRLDDIGLTTRRRVADDHGRWRSPRIMAPRNVMGRLRSRPTTAAAYP